MKLELINKDDQSFAEEKLKQYYLNDMISAEKKPYLANHQKSEGPFLGIESKDGNTHYLLDAASQIATLGLGFNPAVFMGTAHLLESWTNNSNGQNFKKLSQSFGNFLKRKLSWEHIDVTYANSGAESNETALGYAYRRRKNPSANKVLAFEGSFHGRMLVSLSATWNKSKREPFEWDNYLAEYCPFPDLDDAQIIQKIPQNWHEIWDDSVTNELHIPKEWTTDPQTNKEINSLLSVRKKLKTKSIFAIIVEPMQCEGGDRYASNRFFTALTLMAKSFGVEIIFDEVQTGFHLGSDFFWHRTFDLKDINGEQLNPDYVVVAKKAQVGLVLSPNMLLKNEDEKQTQFQVASVVRGYLHALALDQSKTKIKSIQKYSEEKLDQLIKKHSKHISRPRVLGLSFAFDVNDKTKVNDYISKRFEHGLLYYPAGDQTLRFRTNTAFSNSDLDFLFEQLDLLTQEIFEGQSVNKPTYIETIPRQTENIYKWQELMVLTRLQTLHGMIPNQTDILASINSIFNRDSDLSLEIVNKENFKEYKEQIIQIQKDIYEPTRQTSIERFEQCAHSEHGINLVLLKGKKIMAMAFASSALDHPLERGVRLDPEFNNPKNLYVIDTTVGKELQGQGIGRQMKYALNLMAKTGGKVSIKGRNRDQLASAMMLINLSLGSVEQNYIREDYPDFETHRDVIFYRNDLKWNHEQIRLAGATDSLIHDYDLTSEHLLEELPYITNKVCLSNFVSDRFMGQVKKITTLLPTELQHVYTTSGQSECVDKIVKSLWHQTKKGPTLVTFNNHWFGNGSFLSRTLSTQSGEYFPVKKFDDPTKENSNSVLASIEDYIKSNEVLAIFIEPIKQKDMSSVPRDFLKSLRNLTTKYKVNLVYNETVSQTFNYSPDYYFASNDPDLSPNAGMVFLGGQAGLAFTSKELFLAKPLMMISTWDGDEFSFSTYRKGMEILLENKDGHLKLREEFSAKFIKVLANYDIENLKMNHQIGSFSGSIPQKLSSFLKYWEGRYIVNPSHGDMVRFVKEYKA